MLVHVEIPGMSLNLQDPLLRLTGIHPRQTGGIPIGQVFTDCARDGGVRPIRLPGSGTGLQILEVEGLYYVAETKVLTRSQCISDSCKIGSDN